ncbi:LOW QUALITY PROTEIN: hypothetical protein CVT25_000286 [Psilocybe cyanescens]|uniref:Uncharacterized protein n=1 Tax=Psilocybe cyanescens TaxID=93625 RepID=A0A409XS76_PSICY|nr:LOW QUALITY PROTEIN: hypothetical protein CVT25_000286 [Psilocybe cyanescens]
MADAILFSTFRDIQLTQYTQLNSEVGGADGLLVNGKGLILERHSFFRWQGWTSLGVTMMAEGILQIRIYALYLLNKQILAVILTFFLLSSAICAVIMGLVMETLEAKALPIPGGNFCMPVSFSTHFYTFWIPIICFEALLCALALFRGVKISKSIGLGGGSSAFLRSGHHLVNILFRDSLIYFIAIKNFPSRWVRGLDQVPLGFCIAFPCVLSNRLVLNIRSASLHNHPKDDSRGTELTTVNPMSGALFNFRSYTDHTSASQSMP